MFLAAWRPTNLLTTASQLCMSECLQLLFLIQATEGKKAFSAVELQHPSLPVTRILAGFCRFHTEECFAKHAKQSGHFVRLKRHDQTWLLAEDRAFPLPYLPKADSATLCHCIACESSSKSPRLVRVSSVSAILSTRPYM